MKNKEGVILLQNRLLDVIGGLVSDDLSEKELKELAFLIACETYNLSEKESTILLNEIKKSEDYLNITRAEDLKEVSKEEVEIVTYTLISFVMHLHTILSDETISDEELNRLGSEILGFAESFAKSSVKAIYRNVKNQTFIDNSIQCVIDRLEN